MQDRKERPQELFHRQKPLTLDHHPFTPAVARRFGHGALGLSPEPASILVDSDD